MCAGVVPQQPPTMFSSPLSANSPTIAAIVAASWLYWPNSSGSPAFGCALTAVSAIFASASTWGRSCSAPRAQFRPMAIGRACATEYQNASAVWPERVRPLASVIVPEIMTGQRRPCSSKNCSQAKIAALAFSVSNTVSISSRSAPPAIRPSIATR